MLDWTIVVPAFFAEPGDEAKTRYLEFFAATIRNHDP